MRRVIFWRNSPKEWQSSDVPLHWWASAEDARYSHCWLIRAQCHLSACSSVCLDRSAKHKEITRKPDTSIHRRVHCIRWNYNKHLDLPNKCGPPSFNNFFKFEKIRSECVLGTVRHRPKTASRSTEVLPIQQLIRYYGLFTHSLNGNCTGSVTKLAYIICGSFHTVTLIVHVLVPILCH